jgi:hypothetical protein
MLLIIVLIIQFAFAAEAVITRFAPDINKLIVG